MRRRPSTILVTRGLPHVTWFARYAWAMKTFPLVYLRGFLTFVRLSESDLSQGECLWRRPAGLPASEWRMSGGPMGACDSGQQHNYGRQRAVRAIQCDTPRSLSTANLI
jgi:hypothetical protein